MITKLNENFEIVRKKAHKLLIKQGPAVHLALMDRISVWISRPEMLFHSLFQALVDFLADFVDV